ncbi:Uma2 family endonuclease [Mastigocladus laminosus UU774]|nr:Uma2 family endonuclease [Mastigocladus laminosus UU774]
MTQALPKQITVEEFAAWYPENPQSRFELHNGVIVEMPLPVGEHEEIVLFLVEKITLEYNRLNLAFGIPRTVLVKPLENESGYFPDVLILNKNNLINEPIWKKESIITQSASIPLIIEVVSTNWRDDYYKKYADYEEMGIPEYWIVDYAASGGREFVGKPKQPTILVCSLDEGEYRISRFRGGDRIVSPTFPELNLTAEQVFLAGRG